MAGPIKNYFRRSWVCISEMLYDAQAIGANMVIFFSNSPRLRHGTLTLLPFSYPSGRVAVCTCLFGPGNQIQYTYVFDDDEKGSMLGMFTPAGVNCCYDRGGMIRLVSSLHLPATIGHAYQLP